ncbi:DUF805 domain-containing protein [Ligilactobacillus sp. LYQ135]
MNKIHETGEVTFGQALKDFWKGYFDFKGISTRAGFWWGMLGSFIICFGWNIINSIVGLYNKTVLFSIGLDKTMIFITMILNLVLLIPTLAVLVRRFRDVGLKEGVITALMASYIILLFATMIIPVLILLALVLVIVFIVISCMPTGKFNKSNEN